ncbi:MAG: glutamine--fructose-6-phosphate transaminase (isomerizing) [Thiotrichaceae bacterium]|nr:glutamine--fructose-6-phosphate transaminase (isomerizing) [Thiotrichaceae bacterium]
MCGIVGAVAQRPVSEILLEGLHRLEYRGYDSAGIAVINAEKKIERVRAVGRVAALAEKLNEAPVVGFVGISHTRWATHGEPAERNAHPHLSQQRVAVVHNGIIENHQLLRENLQQKGYQFTSDTDTEVVVHLIDSYLEQSLSLVDAVRKTVAQLEGAYALGVISTEEPDTLIAVRQGSPLVVGLGLGETFIGSDVQAMLRVTRQFVYLENGDFCVLTCEQRCIYDKDFQLVERPVKESTVGSFSSDLGQYSHYMHKEIFEQPIAIQATLEGRLEAHKVKPCIRGEGVMETLAEVESVQIVACGTSYHAGLIAAYWMEELTNIPCRVEVASEYRYRRCAPHKNMLFVTLSQSGETADTLAALEKVKQEKSILASLSICNVDESSLVRESDFSLLTAAGPEIGVASTKAFTTQLVVLQLLIALLLQAKGEAESMVTQIVEDLKKLPIIIESILEKDSQIKQMAEQFIDKNNALFLGRGDQYPVAMEGALKLKEISYIHAEAYPAGELKHGPLALVDGEMPIIAVAPNTHLIEKLKSNLEEVRARGGVLYLFADQAAEIQADEQVHIINMPNIPDLIAPIVYTVPLQLLSYYTAVFKGTDVDKPRNLAKSVTVE